MTDKWNWEPVENREMPVVGIRNAHGVLVSQFGLKPGVGFLRRNPGYGPPWVRPKYVPTDVRSLLEEMTHART